MSPVKPRRRLPQALPVTQALGAIRELVPPDIPVVAVSKALQSAWASKLAEAVWLVLMVWIFCRSGVFYAGTALPCSFPEAPSPPLQGVELGTRKLMCDVIPEAKPLKALRCTVLGAFWFLVGKLLIQECLGSGLKDFLKFTQFLLGL